MRRVARARGAHARPARQMTAGERGPMSVAGPVGKFISLGNKAEAFAAFAERLLDCLSTPEARWAAYVLVAMHDVGKSNAFRAKARAPRRCVAQARANSRF